MDSNRYPFFEKNNYYFSHLLSAFVIFKVKKLNNMKNEQLTKLNGLRSDFIKWARNNEPSIWELDVNKIGGKLTGYSREDEPVILLDCTKNPGEWYICKNTTLVDNTLCCLPIEELTEKQIYEIRVLVESWLVKKDINFF